MSRRIVHVLVVTVAALIASVTPAVAASSTTASFNQDEVRIRSAPELNAPINGLGYGYSSSRYVTIENVPPGC
jgi:hypothetical protein